MCRHSRYRYIRQEIIVTCNSRGFTHILNSLAIFAFLIFCLCGAIGCTGVTPTDPSPETSPAENTTVPKAVPHIDRWGIYVLDISTEETELLYSSVNKLAFLDLNKSGDTLAFSQQYISDNNESEEICTLTIEDKVITRITDNNFWDIYPVWAPDGTRMAFLSWRDKGFDIFTMEQNGHNQEKLYDSGHHDADIDWVGDRIAFTAESRIWIMPDNGGDPVPVTEPPRAGLWGKANLPFGDYDPRLSPDGSRIAFERLEDDTSPHGNYNIYIINTDGSGEIRLTDTSYSQGIVSWSHKADKMVFVVSAIEDAGKYDIYLMNADGSGTENITPAYYPTAFLCHTPVFSIDDSRIFFIGQWYE